MRKPESSVKFPERLQNNDVMPVSIFETAEEALVEARKQAAESGVSPSSIMITFRDGYVKGNGSIFGGGVSQDGPGEEVVVPVEVEEEISASPSSVSGVWDKPEEASNAQEEIVAEAPAPVDAPVDAPVNVATDVVEAPIDAPVKDVIDVVESPVKDVSDSVDITAKDTADAIDAPVKDVIAEKGAALTDEG